MIKLTVRDLIEILEGLQQDAPVCNDTGEITEVVVREELYYSENGIYDEGIVVKLY